MKVNECKLSDPVTCSKDSTIKEVAKLFKERAIRYIVVLENKFAVGIISTSDLVSKIVAENKDAKSTKVEQIMITPLFVLKEDEELHTALLSMLKKGLNSCPVVNKENKCIGILTLIELIKRLNKK